MHLHHRTRTLSAAPRRQAHRFPALLVALALSAGGCLDSTTLPESEAMEPFVGDWQAVYLEVREIAAPNRSEELIGQGTTFTLDIQPSGTYTAILTTDLGASVEIGRLEREGTRVRFLREYPSDDVSEGTLEAMGDATIRLVGETRYTFQRTEGPTEAVLDAVLERRPSGD